jgi:RecB family exonuclease
MQKPTLSPTKISTYLACPVKYKWTYIDDRGRWYLRAKKYYSFGTTLHHVLQRFHDAGDTGVATVHQAIAALEESWIEAGYSSAKEMQEAVSEGKMILQSYIEKIEREPSLARTLYLEKLFRLDLEAFVLIGRVDRVQEHPDGTIEIIDYKSGRESITPQEVASDLAMGCYQLLLNSIYPDHQIIASIVALRANQKASASMDQEKLEEFRNDILELGHEILHRDYIHITPIWKPLCTECDFLRLCKKHPEFEEP